MDNSVKHLLEFGPFRIDPEQRLLLRGELPIPLSPKAFDLLLVLTQRDGHVVVKDDLMKLLWPDTFVEESNLAQHIFQLRKALGERAQDSSYIVTVPGRGYRFAQKVRSIPATVPIPEAALEREEDFIIGSHSRSRMVIEESSALVRMTPAGSWNKAIVAAALAIVATAAVAYFLTHGAPKLTTKDTVVLADFANRTGDPVFDGTLRQGLLAQLQQSPFLNLLPDQSVAQTLALMTKPLAPMTKPKDAQLTPEVAREVCQRTASSAVLDGSIAQIGTRYLLTLNATNCSTAEALSSAVAQAADKNHVLDALGKIASETRRKLGESLASVQKYDVPPEKVTTPSLEALQAYSLGRRSESLNRSAESASLYRRAISLDPNFASAYEGLGIDYFNHDEASPASENIQKAFDLRGRVSEREKLGIEVMYYAVVKGNCQAAHVSLLLSTQLFPRVASGFTNLGTMATCLGDYEQSLDAQREALQLSPTVAKNYSNLLIAYLFLNRLDEAEAIAHQTKNRNLDSPFLHANLYLVEFLRHSAGAMQKEADEVMGKPDTEDLILYYESDTAAYSGRFAQASDLTRQATESAARAGHGGVGAAYQAEAALREALAGNLPVAKSQAKHALALSNERDVVAIAAIALGLAGDSADATRLGDDLGKGFPENTAVHYNLLPAIRAATALQSGNAAEAIAALRASTPYELGQTAQLVSLVLYPIYLRGDAYLAARDGESAAAEFQKILAHPGLAQNEVIGALAHLGLGRANVLLHDSTRAKMEYQNFLTLWRTADPDIPILKQAKVEYSKLQ
jgi:DNA-binding winged helix-turn-helix (wHTH) protein/tetratricopeptide (TPR) repeat protein